MNNPQQPREYDAVLGGNSPSLEGAAVLGGIEGVKLRLQNPDLKVRIAAIKEAFNYGEQGLDLLIQVVKDKSLEISTDYEYKQKVKETSRYWYKTWNIDWDYYNKLPEEEERRWEEEQRQWEEQDRQLEAQIKQWEKEEREREEQEREWEAQQREWEEQDRQLEAQIKQWEKEEREREEQDRQWEEQIKQWEEEQRRWKEKWNMDDEYKYNI
ncbi:hypothetical protein [Cuspidothrix issatschenkoi]|uniref:hypothetical protein n=1 Tax=Cuspidothrix issatschenkoi TaxID=230752 RepID=UPI001A9CA413|nr:hypothetical protein [Cuspidothrix issatschenkoi]